MVADSVEFLAGARAGGCSSTPSTSSTATSATPSSASGCSRPRPWPAPTASCCATPTAARCPSRSSASWARSSTTSDTDGRRAPPRRHGLRRGQRPRRRPGRRHPGAGHDQRLRRAHRQLQPDHDHPDLTLKMGVETIPDDRLERLTPVAHHVAELVNISPDPQQAYVGASAFAHKAGLHTSAIARRPDAYEHVDPDRVGNGTRFVVSELAGKSTLELKAQEIGLEIDGPELAEVVDRLKTARARGLPLRGGRRLARAAHARRHGVEPAVLPARVVPGDRRAPGAGRRLQRGRRAPRSSPRRPSRSEVERPARHRHRRGQRPGQRPRRGPAQGHGHGGGPPRARAACT